jgi:DnaJ-class molecular chaperone
MSRLGFWDAHSDLDWYGRGDTEPEPCRECDGTGGFFNGDEEAGTEWVACARCKGEGSEP